jgi:hypothetical protein
MGDAGEGLIDAESRIQERMEDLERERAASLVPGVNNPQAMQAFESLRMARAELNSQLGATTNPMRRTNLTEALAEVDRRIAAVSASL